MRREITYRHHNNIIPKIAVHAAYNGTVPDSGNIQNVFSTIYTLWFIHDGEVELFEPPDRRMRIGAGNWIIAMPGMIRSQSFIPGSRIISIHFSFEQIFLHQFLSTPSIFVLPESQMTGLKAVSEQFVTAYKNTFKIPVDSGSLTRMIEYKTMEYQWFLSLFILLVQHGIFADRVSGMDSRVEAAIDYLEKADHGINVPYDKLEKLCSLSRVQINRLFQEQLGLTPKKICARITLARAMRMLSDHGNNCKDVGFLLHFSTIPHFCNWFRKHSGMTPDQFRRSMNPESPS